MTTRESPFPACRRLAGALMAVGTMLVSVVDTPAAADDEADAVALVQRVRESAISFARGGGDVDRRALETAFDGAEIGRTVLGEHWTSASADDRTAVVDALLDAIVMRLADRLARRRDLDFVVLGTRLLSNGDILVRSELDRSVRKPVMVDWRLRRCSGKLCIGDLIVDGASVTIQRRDQVTAQLAANGGSIPQLVAALREGRL